MPRSPLIRTSAFPYHVTVRSNNRDWFYLPMLQTWEVFEEVLPPTIEAYQLEIHSFVLMSNHFHLTLSTPSRNLDLAMRYLLTEASRRILERSGRINHVFGGRYKWSVLSDPIAWSYVYKYVYRNPVRAGICARCEDYPYSTLKKLMLGTCKFPVVEGLTSLWRWIPRNISERRLWLNQPTPKELEELVTLGLRRYEFQLSSEEKHRANVKRLARVYLVSGAVDNFQKPTESR